MGLIYAEIELINSNDLALVINNYLKAEDVRRMKVKAMVDSGAYMLAINERIKTQLGLTKVGERIAELANGSKEKMEIVGPVDIRFENRSSTVRAMVLPGNSEILLGAIPMEDMDVVINPKQQKLTVNPETPYLAQMSLK